MRIAYLCADRGVPLGGTKGASVHARGVVRALADRGHDVCVLAARSEAPAPGSFPQVRLFGHDPVLKLLRRRIAAERGGEVLAGEAHGLALNLAAAEALEELDRERPVEAVYERLSLWSMAGLRFSRRRGIPIVLEVNAPLVEEQKRYRSLTLEPAARGMEDLLLRESDAIIVPSPQLRAYVHRRAPGRRHVNVIPNGADLKLFGDPAEPPPEARSLRGRYVIAFAGSLKPWHGVEKLLEAFQRVLRAIPEAHLLVLGDGPLRGEVQRVSRRLGQTAVTLAGAVPHENVPAWLAAAHVSVAPYPAIPGFYFSPLKIVESMAAGIPVVASRIGPIPELIQDGRTGLLVQPGSVRALTAALVLLGRHARLRSRLGRAAARRARAHHGWDRVAEKTERILLRAQERVARLPSESPRLRKLREAAGR